MVLKLTSNVQKAIVHHAVSNAYEKLEWVKLMTSMEVQLD